MDVGVTTISEAARDPQAAEKSLEALSEPYVAYLLEQSRKRAFLVAAWEARKCSPATLAALREYEPNVPWRASVLQMRAVCYSAANLDLAAQARADLLKSPRPNCSRSRARGNAAVPAGGGVLLNWGTARGAAIDQRNQPVARYRGLDE